MIYCPFCGTKFDEIDNIDDCYYCLSCGKRSYLNSKPSVCALISEKGRVLLARNKIDQFEWDLPGGFLLNGEEPLVGLRRELNEELKVTINSSNLICIKIDTYQDYDEEIEVFSLNIFYEVSLAKTKITPSSEIIEAKWFSLNELPKLKYTSTREVIEEYVKTWNSHKRLGHD